MVEVCGNKFRLITQHKIVWSCTLFSKAWVCQCLMNRAVSAALHTHQLWRPTLSQGAKRQSRHHLTPERKLRSLKLKYEALEISEVRGAFERKVLMHPGILGSFESNYNCCWGPP